MLNAVKGIFSIVWLIIMMMMNNLYTGASIHLKNINILTVLPTSPVYDFKKIEKSEKIEFKLTTLTCCWVLWFSLN